MIKIVAFIIVSILCCHAAGYYVATNGSNANAGSQAAPWLTVQKAADAMVAGDIAIISNGTYSEKVRSKANGNESSPIIFIAEGTNVNVGAFEISHAYNVISGFRVDGSTATGYRGSITALEGGNYLTVSNIVFVSSPVNVHQLHVYHIGTQATNLTVINSKFFDGKYSGASLNGRNHAVYGNYFTSTNGIDALRPICSNTVISNNVFTNVSNPNLTNGMALVVGLRYWFVTTNGTPDFSNVGAGEGPYLIGEGYAWTATNDNPLSWSYASVRNANHADVIQAFSYTNTTTATNITVINNIAINCTNVQIGMFEDQSLQDSVADWTWINNLFVNVDSIMNIFTPGFKFYNNTFYYSGRNSGSPILFRDSEDRNTANGGEVYNNIFYICGSLPTSTTVGWYGKTAGVTNFQADYNLVIGTGAGTTKTGFAETHGLNGVDPLFVSATDFNLQSTSPARGAGVNLSQYFTTDITGRTRTTWDIGAYEYYQARQRRAVVRMRAE